MKLTLDMEEQTHINTWRVSTGSHAEVLLQLEGGMLVIST